MIDLILGWKDACPIPIKAHQANPKILRIMVQTKHACPIRIKAHHDHP